MRVEGDKIITALRVWGKEFPHLSGALLAFGSFTVPNSGPIFELNFSRRQIP